MCKTSKFKWLSNINKVQIVALMGALKKAVLQIKLK